MPILPVQSIHIQPVRSALLQSSSAATTTTACLSYNRRKLRGRGGRDLAAAEISRDRVLASLLQEHLSKGVHESSRWPGIPSSGNFFLRIAVPAGRICTALTTTTTWCGLRSGGTRLEDYGVSSRRRGRVDCKMAASAVASPVLYKLDSIPNDVPLGVNVSENSRADGRRNDRLIVVGHRGCGKNNALSIGDIPGTRLSVRENTIRSFNLAANNGADNVEFDVQVTKDGHPVIFHDDLILSEDQASRIGDLTLEEFLAFGPQKDGKIGKKMMRKQRDGSMLDWSSTLEDSLCTLKDAFELVDPSLGFNVEIKFHETRETPESELRRVISAALADVENYAKDRIVFFSSFHPTAAIILRQEQNKFPVFFLTDGGERIYNDTRRNSMEAAVDLCIQNGLQGIVTEAMAILRKPQLAFQVKKAGISLFTYGDMNNVAEALVQQYNLNVDGVIVDCVREIVTASRTLHALLNFVQPDWSQFLHASSSRVEAR